MSAVTLTVLAGLPGSGKSSWARAQALVTGATLVSVDDIRVAGADPAFTMDRARRRTVALLKSNADVIVDSCNIHARVRRTWLNIGRAIGARCTLMLIDTPVELCRSRNDQRPEAERVAAETYDRYLIAAQSVLADVNVEGWDEVTVVDGEGQLPTLGVTATSRSW